MRHDKAGQVIELRRAVTDMTLVELHRGLRAHHPDEQLWNVYADELNRRRAERRAQRQQ